jgi:HlyD family secretion protein
MKGNRKRAVVAAVVVLAAAAGFLFFRQRGQNEGSDLSFSGNIELTEVKIAFKIPGKLVELAVREGDSIRKGDVVARLDQDQLLRQRERAQAALASVESQLTQLYTAIEYQKETTRSQIDQRQAELGQAEARLRDLLAGARSQEVEQARAAVSRARTEYENAKSDWERAQTLYKGEDISTSQYDQFRARNDSAAALLRQADEQLAIVIEGPRKDLIEGARADVARARAALRLAESSQLEIKRREQEVEMRRAEIARARADLGLVESQLRDTESVSPIDGVILVKAAEAGEVLAAGTTVVTVGDLDHPWLRGYINEPDLGRIKLGSRVRLTNDSYPDKVYWGKISFLSSQAEFTPKQIQTPEERVKLVYRVKVDVDNPGHELKSNMPVDAEIVPGDQ